MHMMALKWALVFILFGAGIGPMATAGEWKLRLESPEEIASAGGRVHGNLRFVQGHDGKAAKLSEGSFVSVPIAGKFNPEHGSVDMWVCPSWGGDDGSDHTFLHMTNGRAHFTIFKTSGGTLRFTYRGTETTWCAADVPVAAWLPDQWHRITASWIPLGDGSLMIMLKADERERFAMGGVKFAELPNTIVIGSRGERSQPAEAAIDEVVLTDEVLLKPPFVLGKKETVTATIDVSRPTGSMRRVYDFTTIWNSRDVPLPFKEGDGYHKRFAEAEFRLARLIAFSDTWLWGINVERGSDGKIHLDFGDFDRLVDLVRSAGAEPYIRLAYNMPRALSSIQSDDPQLRHKAAYAPPRSSEEWDALMRDIVKHCNVDRKLGVKYFVTSLNEGDIPVRRGESDWQMICDLYETTVRVVREVDPSAKVGGPALAADPRDSGADLMRSFIAFCSKRKLPLDFICFHGYRKGHPREYGEMLDAVKKMVSEEYPGLQPEYFLDEFNLWVQDKKQDNEYGAAYITAAQHFMRRSGITKVSLVCFNHFLPTELPPKDIVSHKGPYDKDGRQASRFIAMQLTAADVEKHGILAHPPTGANTNAYTYGCYDVAIPSDGGPRLSFSTGLAIKPYPKMDGVTFRVVVREDGIEKTVFDRHQQYIPWTQHEISLKEFAGKGIEMEFRTSCGPPGSNTAADWGAWGEPKLVKGPADTPETVYDFIEKITEAKTGARDPGFSFQYDDGTIRRYGGLPLLKGPVVTTPYFALKMQSMLKSRELPIEMEGSGGIAPDDAAGVIASADESGIAILLWTFDLGSKEDREFDIRIAGMKKGEKFNLKQYLIDETHTNPYYDYVIAKKDNNGGRYNLQTGDLDVVRMEDLEAAADGGVRLSLILKPMAVSLITLSQ